MVPAAVDPASSGASVKGHPCVLGGCDATRMANTAAARHILALLKLTAIRSKKVRAEPAADERTRHAVLLQQRHPAAAAARARRSGHELGQQVPCCVNYAARTAASVAGGCGSAASRRSTQHVADAVGVCQARSASRAPLTRVGRAVRHSPGTCRRSCSTPTEATRWA